MILERDLLSDSGSRPVNLQMDPEGEKPSGSVFLGGSPRTPSALTRWGEPSPRGVGCWGRGGGSEWASWGHLELLFGLRGALRSAWRSPVGESLHPEEWGVGVEVGVLSGHLGGILSCSSVLGELSAPLGAHPLG